MFYIEIEIKNKKKLTLYKLIPYICLAERCRVILVKNKSQLFTWKGYNSTVNLVKNAPGLFSCMGFVYIQREWSQKCSVTHEARHIEH